MPLILVDRVKETTTTTGTGTYTLAGAVDGFQSFSVVGNGNTTYYTVTDGTNWEVGLGTYTSSGTTLARTQIFESSNSDTAVNWTAGEKEVFITFPAEVTQGTVPSADGSDVGTDLIGWKALKRYLDSAQAEGKSFNYAVAQTASVVYRNTSTEVFFGGVLAGDESIYYMPSSAIVGQVYGPHNGSGLVRTYSLLYTAIGAFEGGVLAPTGEIHFIPRGGNRGQKVRPGFRGNIVVSTYSLVYTRAAGFSGGVVAPDGSIHFVPLFADRGQKVAANGTVSTYSLVYTNAEFKYIGGCLAPDGAIHFVPNSAPVGQKVAANGTVSTYSLVYTGSNIYRGGVIDLNGNIHFVPYFANRGQRINFDGTVSTYSLPYTLGTGAYAGGVLAPDGTIYFSPYNAVVGTKIDPNGVVSTYSIIITHNGITYTNNGYCGGAYHPRGFIHQVPIKGRSDGFTNNIVTGNNLFVNTDAWGKQMCLSPFVNKAF
jgi:hypothetical protein